jgi:hypothetical protein
MRDDFDELRALLDGIEDGRVAHHDPLERPESRCGDCGCDLDGCVEHDGPTLRDGLCQYCWGEADERSRHPNPIQRVVSLGPDSDATFVILPERTIWIRTGQAAFELRYFDPWGKTDEELAKRIKVLLPFI